MIQAFHQALQIVVYPWESVSAPLRDSLTEFIKGGVESIKEMNFCATAAAMSTGCGFVHLLPLGRFGRG